jgi:membrane associated rhomboid family serine protease
MPVATLSTLCVTGILTGLQYVFPQLLLRLERTPTTLERHEWWRLITPLLMQPDGWTPVVFVFTSILIVGTLAERVWGSGRWLILYIASGLTGEVAGYAWQPSGAGASVAGAGLLGSLATWLLCKCQTGAARFGGAIILIGAVILTCLHGLHGPPILAGAFLGFAMFKTEDSHSGQQFPAKADSGKN